MPVLTHGGAILHDCTNEADQCTDASTTKHEGAAHSRQTLCAPRITMSLERYLRAGRMSHRACFSCGSVSEPMPVRQADTHGRERRCGLCGQEAALAVDVALREGWLCVVDSDDRALNDTRQVAEVA